MNNLENLSASKNSKLLFAVLMLCILGSIAFNAGCFMFLSEELKPFMTSYQWEDTLRDLAAKNSATSVFQAPGELIQIGIAGILGMALTTLFIGYYSARRKEWLLKRILSGLAALALVANLIGAVKLFDIYGRLETLSQEQIPIGQAIAKLPQEVETAILLISQANESAEDDQVNHSYQKMLTQLKQILPEADSLSPESREVVIPQISDSLKEQIILIIEGQVNYAEYMAESSLNLLGSFLIIVMFLGAGKFALLLFMENASKGPGHQPKLRAQMSLLVGGLLGLLIISNGTGIAGLESLEQKLIEISELELPLTVAIANIRDKQSKQVFSFHKALRLTHEQYENPGDAQKTELKSATVDFEGNSWQVTRLIDNALDQINFFTTIEREEPEAIEQARKQLTPIFEHLQMIRAAHNRFTSLARSDISMGKTHETATLREQEGSQTLRAQLEMEMQLKSFFFMVQGLTGMTTLKAEIDEGNAGLLAVIVGLIALIYGAGFGLILRSGILRRVGGEPDQIAALANRIANGELNVTFDQNQDKSSIYGSLGIMVSALKSNIDELQRLNATVQEQNEILNDTNQAIQRFVPFEFLELMDKNSILHVNLGDNIEREMTVLFSDIRDFTSISEALSPQETFEFVNAYLNQVGPVIRQHKGFIDKYIGDAVMALFDSADNAVNAAVSLLEQVDHFNRERAKQGKPPIRIGIGLNTGKLMLGTIGEQNRMESTVISDSVNLAARIEGMTKMYGAAMLISENTFHALEEHSAYEIRIIDKVTVKGKSEPVTVYEVFGNISPEEAQLKLSTQDLFKQGISKYYQRKFEESKPLFQECLDLDPGDRAAAQFIKNCDHFLKVGWDENWDGVTHLDSK
ncbi:MAG: hypothetical protein HQM13_13815 [SAR324 cluster bacterium]|nr:hypothetical protein [SAR324 cluster bacterium]